MPEVFRNGQTPDNPGVIERGKLPISRVYVTERGNAVAVRGRENVKHALDIEFEGVVNELRQRKDSIIDREIERIGYLGDMGSSFFLDEFFLPQEKNNDWYDDEVEERTIFAGRHVLLSPLSGQEDTFIVETPNADRIAEAVRGVRGLHERAVVLELLSDRDRFSVDFDQVLGMISAVEGLPTVSHTGEEIAQHFATHDAGYPFWEDDRMRIDIFMRAGRRYQPITVGRRSRKKEQDMVGKYENTWRAEGAVLNCPVPEQKRNPEDPEHFIQVLPAIDFVIRPIIEDEDLRAKYHYSTFDPEVIAKADAIANKLIDAFSKNFQRSTDMTS